MQAIEARRPLYRGDLRRTEAVRDMASPGAAVEAQGLAKTYGDVRAVDGLDLRIEANSIYALLGPNGAGKTTALSILTTVLEPTAGRARVCGRPRSLCRRPCGWPRSVVVD
jgi:ABC-type sugar transport system ATPase subunit